MTTFKAASIAAIVPVLMIGALQIMGAAPFVASDPGVRGDPPGAGARRPRVERVGASGSPSLARQPGAAALSS